MLDGLHLPSCPFSHNNRWILILGPVHNYLGLLELAQHLDWYLLYRIHGRTMSGDNQSLAPNPLCKPHGHNQPLQTSGERSFMFLNHLHKGLVVLAHQCYQETKLSLFIRQPNCPAKPSLGQSDLTPVLATEDPEDILLLAHLGISQNTAEGRTCTTSHPRGTVANQKPS